MESDSTKLCQAFGFTDTGERKYFLCTVIMSRLLAFNGFSKLHSQTFVEPQPLIWLRKPRFVSRCITWYHQQLKNPGRLFSNHLWTNVGNSAEGGENQLAVEVINTWHNRLIGDSRVPATERLTRTNILVSQRKPWKDHEPIESGLFGPVRLVPSSVGPWA